MSVDLLERMAPYRGEASWAVWELDSAGELTGGANFPLDLARVSIHGESMIVSLNPATRLSSSPDDPHDGWSNFHSDVRKHNDLFLAEALHRTELWGAYMTDLHPSVYDPKSGNVRPPREQVESAVRSLIDQARLLSEVEVIVAVGAKTHASIRRHADLIRREIGDVRIARIPHYSRANAGVHKHKVELYREFVATGLNAAR